MKNCPVCGQIIVGENEYCSVSCKISPLGVTIKAQKIKSEQEAGEAKVKLIRPQCL
jgi:hypothetical protein